MFVEEDGLPAPVGTISFSGRFTRNLEVKTHLMWEARKMKITEVVANSLYRYQNLAMEFVLEQRLLQL
jgi:hypothetical protein